MSSLYFIWIISLSYLSPFLNDLLLYLQSGTTVEKKPLFPRAWRLTTLVFHMWNPGEYLETGLSDEGLVS